MRTNPHPEPERGPLVGFWVEAPAHELITIAEAAPEALKVIMTSQLNRVGSIVGFMPMGLELYVPEDMAALFDRARHDALKPPPLECHDVQIHDNQGRAAKTVAGNRLRELWPWVPDDVKAAAALPTGYGLINRIVRISVGRYDNLTYLLLHERPSPVADPELGVLTRMPL